MCIYVPKITEWHNRHHRFAAFRVVVDVCDKDNVFDGSVWPIGADVRDWWFSSKQS